MSIIPLHLHSHWSLLDGVPTVREIVDFAQTLGLPALALTDSNALYGVIEFASCCREAGIHPIIGAELTITGGHHIVLLAQNREGYANLCRLITRLQAAPDREASLAGVQLAAHRFSGRQEEPMLLVDMDDEAGMYQVLWSGSALKEYRSKLAQREPVVICGRVRSDRQGRTIVVGKAYLTAQSER